jgi:hypothetical protein
MHQYPTHRFGQNRLITQSAPEPPAAGRDAAWFASAWRRAPLLARPLSGARSIPACFGKIITTVRGNGEMNRT